MKKITKKHLNVTSETIRQLRASEIQHIVNGAAVPGSLKCTEKGNSLCVALGCV